MEKVFEIYIRTTPERLWEAITDPEIRSQVQLRRRVPSPTGRSARASSWAAPTRPGLLGEGEVLEVDPPRRLVHTMTALWSDEVKSEGRVPGHLGDRAGRRLLPPAAHPRPAARRGQRPALRRLAHDPLGAQDLARDRGEADHAGIAHVRRVLTSHRVGVSTGGRPYAAKAPEPTRRTSWTGSSSSIVVPGVGRGPGQGLLRRRRPASASTSTSAPETTSGSSS